VSGWFVAALAFLVLALVVGIASCIKVVRATNLSGDLMAFGLGVVVSVALSGLALLCTVAGVVARYI